MASGEWTIIRKPGMRRESVAEGEQWEQYRDEMEKYFRASAELLKVVGVPFDEIWYEDVVTQEHIWLKKAACYVRNCNFRR